MIDIRSLSDQREELLRLYMKQNNIATYDDIMEVFWSPTKEYQYYDIG